jgi:hypothetical protein
MPLMQDTVAVLLNSVSVNVLSGQLYEFIEPGTTVTVSATGSVTGLRTTYICGVPVINDQAIGLQNRFPLIPDDIITSGPMPGGRQILTFRNTTAGTITAFWRVDL